MSTTLNVRLRHDEGALQRLLGQIGRRGYDILDVTAHLSADGKTFDVRVEFEPFIPMAPGKPRPVEVLPALCRKLADVVSAELAEPAARPPAEPPGNGSPHAPRPPAAKPTGDMKWDE